MKPYLPLILLLVLLASCQRDDFSGMEITEGRKTEVQAEQETENGDEASSTLASKVIGELQSNLSSSRASRTASKSAPPVSISLTEAQVQAVADAATQVVSSGGLGESEDLIALLPKIVEGGQGSLKKMGLNASETIKVVQVVVPLVVQRKVLLADLNAALLSDFIHRNPTFCSDARRTWPISDGSLAQAIPACSNAANFSAAVPFPPEIIAPA